MISHAKFRWNRLVQDIHDYASLIFGTQLIIYHEKYIVHLVDIEVLKLTIRHNNEILL